MSEQPSNTVRVQHKVDQIFQLVETEKAAFAVVACTRLSKLVNDPFSYSFFTHLQENAGTEAARSIIEAFPDIDKKTLTSILQTSLERVSEVFRLSDAESSVLGVEQGMLMLVGSNFLDAQIELCAGRILALDIPNNVNETDAAAFYIENKTKKFQVLQHKQALLRIKSNILSGCTNFAMKIENQIPAREFSTTEMEAVFDRVTAFLRASAPTAETMLIRALEYLKRGDPESISSSMLQIRRCLKETADYLQPATSEDGLTEDKYLNRLCYHIEATIGKSKLVKLETEMLEKLLRQVAEGASKGVHAKLPQDSARQIVFLSVLYLDSVTSMVENS